MNGVNWVNEVNRLNGVNWVNGMNLLGRVSCVNGMNWVSGVNWANLGELDERGERVNPIRTVYLCNYTYQRVEKLVFSHL